MQVVILAGGFGTRLAEETVIRPKPMVEIGGRPILWHIMKHYGHYGFNEYLIALGYKGEVIKEYFLNYFHLSGHVSVNLATGAILNHDTHREPWLVHLVNTGLNTQTGGRIKRLQSWIGDNPFMLTYGDGVAALDLQALVTFHRAQGRLATISAVRPPARFGDLRIEGELVRSFTEKPQAGEGWINGGYMVLEPRVFDYISGDDTSFERDVLEQLARDEQLAAYCHDGFWQSMDTLRDKNYLEAQWSSGEAAWKIWHD